MMMKVSVHVPIWFDELVRQIGDTLDPGYRFDVAADGAYDWVTVTTPDKGYARPGTTGHDLVYRLALLSPQLSGEPIVVCGETTNDVTSLFLPPKQPVHREGFSPYRLY